MQTPNRLYPVAVLDFVFAGYLAFISYYVWAKAIEQLIPHGYVENALFESLRTLFIVGLFVLTGCFVLWKRWLAATVLQFLLTVGLAVNTGHTLLWLLVSGPGKHQDPQNGIVWPVALTFATLVSLVDTRHLFNKARNYGATHPERG